MNSREALGMIKPGSSTPYPWQYYEEQAPSALTTLQDFTAVYGTQSPHPYLYFYIGVTQVYLLNPGVALNASSDCFSTGWNSQAQNTSDSWTSGYNYTNPNWYLSTNFVELSYG